MDSIVELLKVRGEAQELKHHVTGMNRKLQHEGKELVMAMEELKQFQLQHRNISATVDKLILCRHSGSSPNLLSIHIKKP